jgi:hypothetical protein
MHLFHLNLHHHLSSALADVTAVEMSTRICIYSLSHSAGECNECPSICIRTQRALGICFGDPRPWAPGVDHAIGTCREIGSVMGTVDEGAGSSVETSEGLSLGLVDSV